VSGTGSTKEDGRTRNGRATRERVYEAAITVFASRGYDSATMDEIAAEAGVARRTAFNHFPAKADIASAWAVRRGERAFALAQEADRSGRHVTDRVAAYFHELALMTERDWDETRQMTTGWLRGFGVPHHRPWLAGELRDWLREWLSDPPAGGVTAAGADPDEASAAGADPGLATDVLYDVFQGVLLRWLPQQAFRPGEFTAEADAAVAVVLAGLAAGAGSTAPAAPAAEWSASGGQDGPDAD
jgi:AcrR family transcriptional regulator